MNRLIVCAVLVAVSASGLGACGTDSTPASTKLSALGEGCAKSADCSGNLVCIAGSCAAPGTGADAMGSTDAADGAGGDDIAVGDGTDAVSADGDTSPDACDPTCPAGTCISPCGTPCEGACTDNNACTTADMCVSGKCTGQAVPCDDKNPCTDDTCDPSSGCKHTTNSASCEDDNPCTVGDACKSGACEAGAAKSCASGDSCVVGKCAITGGGKCVFADAGEGTGCDDGSVCTLGDVCKAGACSGTKVDCDDKNPCTADTCEPAAGCQHQNVAGPCDDGNLCTEADSCKDGACQAGAPKTCDDGVPCTKDSCSLKSGACANDAAALDGTACDADGSVCTAGDVCASGTCVVGGKVSCEDGNACTSDTCDPKAGCLNAAITGACNADDNACTVDACAAGKCAAGPAKACNDSNACTSDLCDLKTGQCGYTVLADGISCDANATAGCNPVACKAGSCLPATPPNCNDGNVCTVDACTDSGCLPGAPGCVPKAECAHMAATGACDADGSVCTVSDACAGGACVAGALNSCDDANPCTDDSCDAKTGCAHTPNTASCTDGDPCTADTCVAAKCVSTAVPCDPCLALGGTVATIGSAVRICSGKIGEAKIKDYKIYGGWKACTVDDMIALTKTGDHYADPAWTNTACTTSNQPGHMIYKGTTWVGALSFNSADSYSCSSDYCCGYGPSQLLICKP